MKRFFLAVITLILFLMVLNGILPALATASDFVPTATVPAFDWTPVLVIVIGAGAGLVSLLIGHLWRHYLHPWLKDRNLLVVAETVVYAVEALLGRYCGEDKWNLALEKMHQRGFNVNSEKVIDALKAAWKQLDLKQLLAGEKGDRLVAQLDTDCAELRNEETVFAGCDEPVPELAAEAADSAELLTEEITLGIPAGDAATLND